MELLVEVVCAPSILRVRAISSVGDNTRASGENSHNASITVMKSGTQSVSPQVARDEAHEKKRLRSIGQFDASPADGCTLLLP